MCYWYCHCNNNTFKKPDFNRCFYFTKISVALSSSSVNPCKIFSVYSCKRYTSVNLWGAGWEKWDVDLLIHSYLLTYFDTIQAFSVCVRYGTRHHFGLGFPPGKKILLGTYFYASWMERDLWNKIKTDELSWKRKGGARALARRAWAEDRSLSLWKGRRGWDSFRGCRL